MTPYQRLISRAATSGADPFVTWYGGDGSRIDLSVTSFTNAVAKLAGLLNNELAVAPGNTLLLDLPRHWQLSVWLAAADALGMDIEQAGTGVNAADVIATTDPRCELPGEKVLVPTSAMGLPGPSAPVGFVDQAREAMGQPDIFPDLGVTGRIRHQQGWFTDMTLRSHCRELAEASGLKSGGRLAVVDGGPDLLLAAYVLPLTADASIVLVEDPKIDVSAESVTARL